MWMTQQIPTTAELWRRPPGQLLAQIWGRDISLGDFVAMCLYYHQLSTYGVLVPVQCGLVYNEDEWDREWQYIVNLASWQPKNQSNSTTAVSNNR